MNDMFPLVINTSTYPFRLSEEALVRYQEYSRQRYFQRRDDPCLVRVVQELKEQAGSHGCQLQIMYIPLSLRHSWTIVRTKEGEEVKMDRQLQRLYSIQDDKNTTMVEKRNLIKRHFESPRHNSV